MAVFPNIRFYNFNPIGSFSTTVGGTTTYTGPATATGTATITDNEPGIEGDTLDDDNNGAETATADVTIGALTSIGSNVDGEAGWTLRDTVTGQVFQITAFDVENGAAAGDYLISEIPLVVGRVYETIAYDSNPNAVIGDPVVSYTDFYEGWGLPNGRVDGTTGNDLIDNTYVDAEGEVIDGGDGTGPAGNADLVYALDGNDTVIAGDGNDTVYGGAGDDSLVGGDGNDEIYGDFGAGTTSTNESLNWSAANIDEGDISVGFTQNTGEIDVSVSFASDGTSTTLFEVETTDTVYVDTLAGEPMSTSSSTYIFGEGLGPTSTTTIDFAAATGSQYSNEVENVIFRINDIDEIDGNHKDIVTVLAFDANGTPVNVDITLPPNTNDTYDPATNTITAGGNSNDTPAQSQGSVLVTIAGPVSSIQIIYSNAEDTLTGSFTGTHAIWVTDVHFDTVLPSPGDDTLTGGLGADSLFGEAGNDTFFVAEGDVAQGGDGDDTFNVVDLGEAGFSTINVIGGETGETVGDTLNLGGLIGSLSDITYTNTNDTLGGLSGFVTLNDGTLLTFSEIETILFCYGPGTLIDTPDGARLVEDLRPGDQVSTKDRGAQTIRWSSCRDTPLEQAESDQKPVVIKRAALGKRLPTHDLVVSPQHRVLVGAGGQLEQFFSKAAFVPAKSLTSLPGIRHMNGKQRIKWHHFACDRHEVVTANGCQSESLLLGPMVVNGLTTAERRELADIFRPLGRQTTLNGPAARPCLKVGEVRRRLKTHETRRGCVEA